MRILVCDTSNTSCCAGVYDIELAGTDIDIKEISYRVSLERRTHSEVIMPLMAEVVEEAKADEREIDAYAVTKGPGSFTGVRIGISAIKGMCAVTGKDVIPVSSTQALAKSCELLPYDGGTVLIPCFDARNNRVFAAVYDENEEILVEENAYDANDLCAKIKDLKLEAKTRVILCGNGAKTMLEAMNSDENKASFADLCLEDASGAVILPKGIARSCLSCVQKNKEDAIIPAVKLAPTYCARSSADRFRKPPQYSVKEAVEEDITGIMVLEAEGIDHPWVREEIKDLIDSDKKIALVAKEISVEDPVGYVGVTVTIDEAEIGNICVSGKYRRTGVGRLLMNELLSRLREMGVKQVFLEVRDNNAPAIALYEKTGFEKISVRRDYYGTGSDALIYKIEL